MKNVSYGALPCLLPTTSARQMDDEQGAVQHSFSSLLLPRPGSVRSWTHISLPSGEKEQKKKKKAAKLMILSTCGSC